MSSTIVNTLIGFGLAPDDAVKISGEVSVILDELRTEMNKLSRDIDLMVAEFHAYEARMKALESALAEEGPHENIVPLHGATHR